MIVISELKVLKTKAGWYVGRTYTNIEEGEFDFPYSRDSKYFKTKEKAESHLSFVLSLEAE